MWTVAVAAVGGYTLWTVVVLLRKACWFILCSIVFFGNSHNIPCDENDLPYPPIFVDLVLVWIYYSVQLPRSQIICNMRFFEWMRRRYLPLTQEGLGSDGTGSPTSSQTIYAIFPHGLYPISAMLNWSTNPKYARVRVVVSSILFWIPIARELASITGAVPATKENIEMLLNQGHSIAITPEGIRSALHVNEGPEGVMRVLRGIPGESKARKGFIRSARNCKNAHRIKIVPVYCADMYKLYQIWVPFPRLQSFMLSNFYYPWPFVVTLGRWKTFFPRSHPMHLVFGNPIELEEPAAEGADASPLLRRKDTDCIFEELCTELEKIMGIDKK